MEYKTVVKCNVLCLCYRVFKRCNFFRCCKLVVPNNVLISFLWRKVFVGRNVYNLMSLNLYLFSAVQCMCVVRCDVAVCMM